MFHNKINLFLLFVFIISYKQLLAQEFSSHGHIHSEKEIFDHSLESHSKEIALLLKLDSLNENSTTKSSSECSVDNFGFENASLDNWVSSGNVQLTNSGFDPYGFFPKVFPGGGSYSVRLGSDDGVIDGRLSRIISVPVSGQTFLSFHFAIAIFNYPHNEYEAAKFTVKFYDDDNNLIPCPNYECFYSSGTGAVGLDQFQITPNPASFYNSYAEGAYPNEYGVSWSDWNDVSIDLTSFAGQNVKIVISADECVYGPDWCYAYFDMDCLTNTAESQQICTTFPTIIEAPAGMSTYSWFDQANNLISNSQTLNVTSPGNYELVLTPYTSDCPSSSDIVFNYGFDENPTVNFLASNVCFGEELTFTNNSSNNVFNYFWDFGDGTLSSIENPNHSYSSVGNFDATLIGETAYGCRDTVTQTVIIHPSPIAEFSSYDLCYGSAVTFNNNSSISSGTIINNWFFESGSSSNLQNPSHVFTNTGQFSVSLTVTSDSSCVDTATQVITVYPNPSASFSSTSKCLGFVTDFVNTSSVQFPSNIDSYEWFFGDGNSSTAQNPMHQYGNSGDYMTTLIVETPFGCKDSTEQVVTVFPKPNASFYGQNLMGCSPLCIDFLSTSTIEMPGVLSNFSWQYSDGNQESGVSINRCFENTSDIPNYYGLNLIVESTHGCLDTVSSALDYIQVYDLPFSSFNFTPSNPDIIHSEVEFKNTSQNADEYQWSFGDGGVSNQENPIHDYIDEPLSYTIELIAKTEFGCTDTSVRIITIEDQIIYYIPNTFTPDGDEYNNEFKPIFTSGIDPYDYSFFIYNRWGELIFESHNIEIGWDGVYNDLLCQEGTYVWKIDFKTRAKDERKSIQGHVNLLK